MDIYWYGQACFKLKGKNAVIIIDPFEPDFIGLKLPKDFEADICLLTHTHKDHNNSAAVGGSPMVLSGAGEYEVRGVIVSGIDSFHDNVNGAQRGLNTVYHILIDGLNVVHLGDLGQDHLTEEQLSAIGQTDILLIPVGSIYTIDGKVASEIVSQLEPKIIIPMHYLIAGLKVELQDAGKFLREMGAEGVESQLKLSITKDKLREEPMVVVLSKS